MSFHQDDFEDLERLIYGPEDPINALIQDLSSEQSYQNFCDEILQEDESSTVLEQVLEGGIFQEPIMALNDGRRLDTSSSLSTEPSAGHNLGADFSTDTPWPLPDENPRPTGYEGADYHPLPDLILHHTGYQNTNPRPLPEPFFHPTHYQNSDYRPSPEQNPYQTRYAISEQTPRGVFAPIVVNGHGESTMDDVQASLSFPSVYNDDRLPTESTYINTLNTAGALNPFGILDNSFPKREPSRTESRRLSEITAEGDQTLENSAIKRKRSSEVEETNDDHSQGNSRPKRRRTQTTLNENDQPECDDSPRPKWGRKNVNENARYRRALKLHRGEPSCPESVKRLFKHLKSETIPKKAYYRKKGSEATVPATAPGGQPVTQAGTAAQVAASHQPPPPAASTVLSGTAGADSSNTSHRRTRQANPRQHIPVETVREAAPEGWDPYNNEYYSGDDNVSDGEVETQGKATDRKPPRMACRRCNRLKQPCDHKYPACSLCEKNGERCRYRDDLTGRQIRPGQLEEVEVALHDAQKEIRRLKRQMKEMREAQNPRDEPRDNPRK